MKRQAARQISTAEVPPNLEVMAMVIAMAMGAMELLSFPLLLVVVSLDT